MDELDLAGLYDQNARRRIEGRLLAIDSNSMAGKWKIDMEFWSEGVQPFPVSVVHDFKTSYYGTAACDMTAQALGPAVQDLIGKALVEPQFQAILAGER